MINMGNEQLTSWQKSQLSWLKKQVDNLADESKRNDARPRIEQELFAAREELDDYVENLKQSGVAIEHGRRSWLY
jgi:biotin operon repressor